MATLKEVFTNIASAIREKIGSTATITPSEMPALISSIETGVDTSDATAAAADILKGKTAYADGEKITGTIASKSATTYTPDVNDQTIAAGQYLSGDQTIIGDANLSAAKLPRGVSLFGIEGIHNGMCSGVFYPSSTTNATFSIIPWDDSSVDGNSKLKFLYIYRKASPGWPFMIGRYEPGNNTITTNQQVSLYWLSQSEGYISGAAAAVMGDSSISISVIDGYDFELFQPTNYLYSYYYIAIYEDPNDPLFQ